MLGVRIAYLLMITRVIQFSAKQFQLSLDLKRDIIRQRKVHVIVGRLTTLASAVSLKLEVRARFAFDSFFSKRIGES